MPYAKFHIKEKEKARYLRRKENDNLQEYKYECILKDKADWNKGKNNPMYGKIGPSAGNWKGGLTPVNNKSRNSFEYKNWRSDVYSRDGWVCQTCGSREKIEAHHIKSFSKFKLLRYNISNGVTLCRECHLLVHRLTKLNGGKIKWKKTQAEL